MISSLRLPEELRADYSVAWGLVVRGGLRGYLEALEGVICVGDYVASMCAEAAGVLRHVILVVDGRVMRGKAAAPTPLKGVIEKGFNEHRVVNPPGGVTGEAYDLICKLLGKGRHIVYVEGEEDMLALPSIACMEERWATIYGIPGKGSAIIYYSHVTSAMANTRFLSLTPKIQ